MKRPVLAVALLVAVGCSDPVDPLEHLPIYPGWSLVTVDGRSPPIPDDTGGSLVSAGLRFLEFASTGSGQGSGVVQYATHVLRAGTLDRSIVQFDFTIGDGTLRINLCPRLSACIAAAELAGPVTGGTTPLLLTQYLAGQPGSVLQFQAALPE